jgi:4,5-dihydroxyphthalate decarboxylase
MQNVIALIGEDWWPYGIAPNRRVLETLARYHHEQRLSHRKIGIEEMFAPEILTD